MYRYFRTGQFQKKKPFQFFNLKGFMIGDKNINGLKFQKAVGPGFLFAFVFF